MKSKKSKIKNTNSTDQHSAEYFILEGGLSKKLAEEKEEREMEHHWQKGE